MSQKVSYFYDSSVGSIYYGPGHPMKPLRMKMTHQLVLGYGLHKKLNIYEPHRASVNEMCAFHSEDYIKHLKSIVPNVYSSKAANASRAMLSEKHQFNIGDSHDNDCPSFPGMFDLA